MLVRAPQAIQQSDCIVIDGLRRDRVTGTCRSSHDCGHREDDIVALELFPEHALVSDVPTHELKMRIGDVLEKAGLAVGKVVQNGH